MRQRRVTPRVLRLGHLQMGQWDRGQTPLTPTLTPAPRHSLLTHLWVQGCRAVPTPIAAGGSPATLHPWGQTEHPLRVLGTRVGQPHRASTPRVPDAPIQHGASPISRSRWEPGLTIG